MKNDNEKKYEHNGKIVKIIPAKRVKKVAVEDSEDAKDITAPVARKKKAESEKGVAKFSVNDKVSLKNIPPEYSGYGFAESTVIKVFKSTSENEYRYTIKSSTGQEMALLKENQLKVRKINFKK